MSSVRDHYTYAWPAIVHALGLWLSLVDFKEDLQGGDLKAAEKEREKNLHLVMGE